MGGVCVWAEVWVGWVCVGCVGVCVCVCVCVCVFSWGPLYEVYGSFWHALDKTLIRIPTSVFKSLKPLLILTFSTPCPISMMTSVECHVS